MLSLVTVTGPRARVGPRWAGDWPTLARPRLCRLSLRRLALSPALKTKRFPVIVPFALELITAGFAAGC